MADVYVRVDLELDGFLGGWTDVTDDVVEKEGVFWRRGLPGPTVHDGVAGVGLGTFTLHNSTVNSLGLDGAYTFNHTNVRAGFEKNIGVRISWVLDGDVIPQWTGRLRKATAAAGLAGERVSRCVAADYMYQCERKSLGGLELQTEITDDEVFSMIVAAQPVQPRALRVGTGFDTFAYVFHNMKAERAVATSEFQQLAQSTLCKIFVEADGTLVYEPRAIRARNITTNVATITEDDFEKIGLEVSDDRDDVINRVQTILHPPTVGGEEVVLFSLPGVVAIEPNQPLPLRGLFTEPGQRAFRAGGLDMLAPDPLEGDYEFNTEADGSGSDVTDDATVEALFTANSVLFTITVPVACYMLALQARGIGVFDNANVAPEAVDQDSIDVIGENPLSLDMKYISDVVFGDEVARYILSLAQQNAKRVVSVPFLLNGLENARADLFVRREISDRIGFEDFMTSLPTSTSSGFHINAIEGSAQGGICRLKWTMGPSDSTQYWQLEIPGRSELDLTTVLGFSLIVGHTDVNHADDHDDTAHTDVAHADTHGDVAHADAAHTDSAHTDTAHSDSAHSDTAHTDVAHSDTHSDAAHNDGHQDVAHIDSHSDTELHGDTPGGHGDTIHFDSHSDEAHGDEHFDVGHTDDHSDEAHADVSHVDANHADQAHADAGHADAGHADTAHTDTHTDTAHTDVAHADDHSDIEHGDQN